MSQTTDIMNIDEEIRCIRQLEIGKSLFDDLLHCLDDIHVHEFSDGINF